MPTGLQSETINHTQRRIQESAADEVVGVLTALNARELVEPAALLSAGYLALPFIVKQLLLLLLPVVALLGFVPQAQGEQHDWS